MAAQARRELSGRILAATLRSVRNLDIAEESTADAFLLALQSWPTTGIPASVEAWLVTASRRRAVDRIRRARVARRSLVTLAGGWSGVTGGSDRVAEAAVVGDDELRMVVLCCDPRLTPRDQVALTLRLACGVSTAGIAAAYGVSTPTIAARLTRAKAKLAAAGPLLELPDDATVDVRLPVVARVVHLAFTLGHTAADGEDLTDDDLADRAQYLAGVLHALRPASASFTALLALILLTRARAVGRLGLNTEQVLLDEANRRLWDRRLIGAGIDLLGSAPTSSAADPLVLQAAIAAEHSRAPRSRRRTGPGWSLSTRDCSASIRHRASRSDDVWPCRISPGRTSVSRIWTRCWLSGCSTAIRTPGRRGLRCWSGCTGRRMRRRNGDGPPAWPGRRPSGRFSSVGRIGTSPGTRAGHDQDAAVVRNFALRTCTVSSASRSLRLCEPGLASQLT